MRTKRWLEASATAWAVAMLAACGAAEEDEAGGGAGADYSQSAEPIVRLETNQGTITLELADDRTPGTVYNFLRYVQDGFYEGTIIHRVDPRRVIQGGSYTPSMAKKIEGLRPPIENEWKSGLQNARGTIGMVRATGMPDSAQAEFYINVANNPNFDTATGGSGYTAFGEVIEGMDVVDRIASMQLEPPPGQPDGVPTVPSIPIVIEGARLVSDYDVAQLEQEATAAQEEIARTRAEEAAAEQAQIEELMEQTREEYGAEWQQSPSGLVYGILREGDGPKPEGPSDSVRVHYKGWLPNGKVFDSSYERGAPATFRLSQVIAGWTEGVGDMRVGEMRRLIIPGELGYGAKGAEPDIGPDQTLIFDVELLELPE